MENAEQSQWTEHAICHEAGHIVIAKSLGIKVICVRVTGGKANTVVCDLDSPDRTLNDKFVYLAGGIAGEQVALGNFDTGGMGCDQNEISERGGESIEAYLPLASKLIDSKKPCFNRIKMKLTQELMNAGYDELDSFDVLSESDLDQIWSAC